MNQYSYDKKNIMMTYGKAKGMVLLEKYLPDLNPFKNINIISSIEQWEQVKDNYSDRVTCRIDTKIGDKRNVRIEGASGKKEDVPDILKNIKSRNPDAVLLLLETQRDVFPRYENQGGFNVLFNLNESVIIELVGKGFDGRELTREKAVHERYVIPWEDALFIRNKMDLQKNKNVEKYLVDGDEYKRTRDERIQFLNSIEKNKDEIEKAVPKTYQQVSDHLIEDILNKIIFNMYQRKRELYEDNLKMFTVMGNIVDGKLEAWEIFRPERLISKDLEER